MSLHQGLDQFRKTKQSFEPRCLNRHAFLEPEINRLPPYGGCWKLNTLLLIILKTTLVLFKLIIRHGILARNSRGANLFLFMLLQFFALLFILKHGKVSIHTLCEHLKRRSQSSPFLSLWQHTLGGKVAVHCHTYKWVEEGVCVWGSFVSPSPVEHASLADGKHVTDCEISRSSCHFNMIYVRNIGV